MSPDNLIVALHWRSFAFVYFGHLFLFFDFSVLGFLVHDVLNSWDWGGYLIFPATNYKYNYSFGFFSLLIHLLLNVGNVQLASLLWQHGQRLIQIPKR